MGAKISTTDTFVIPPVESKAGAVHKTVPKKMAEPGNDIQACSIIDPMDHRIQHLLNAWPRYTRTLKQQAQQPGGLQVNVEWIHALNEAASQSFNFLLGRWVMRKTQQSSVAENMNEILQRLVGMNGVHALFFLVCDGHVTLDTIRAHPGQLLRLAAHLKQDKMLGVFRDMGLTLQDALNEELLDDAVQTDDVSLLQFLKKWERFTPMTNDQLGCALRSVKHVNPPSAASAFVCDWLREVAGMNTINAC